MEGPGLNWQFTIKVLGFTLGMESFFLFLTTGISYYYGGWDTLYLLLSGGIALFLGVILVFFGSREKVKYIGKRESFLTVTLSWLMFTCVGTLPFYISGAIPSLTDAFFETMSGLTTTGSTILTDIENLPKGLLFWRSILQWLGGMGMIVFSLALLPLIGGGAAQLFDAETTGITHDKFRPRVTQVAKRLWGIYTGLTILLVILLSFSPMSFFDAICHAFTTISTGGYSTKQDSIAYWDSIYIDYIIVFFMLIGSINFSLFYFLFKGNFQRFYKDEELRWYLLIVFFSTLLITFYLVEDNLMLTHGSSFRSSIFQVVSVISTTGFVTGDYIEWGPFYWIIFLLLMIVCGCAGSTSGGMKTIRVVVLAKNTLNEFRKLIHPRAIIPVRLNNAVLSMDVVQRIVAFVFLYIIIILVSWLVLAFSGMGFIESLGAAVSAVSNTGPGLGDNGPTGSFANVPAFSKWYMSFLMLVGRLEVFTVLILFTPGFWKK